jgi:asparagine synthase (glutamine-hydrolysing)
MLEIVDRLPEFFDEPFADSSAIPTFLVSGVARRRVTVALSGDGGDELFFGYPRYFYADRARWLISAPRTLRRAAAAVANVVPVGIVKRASHLLRDDDPDPYARFISWWSRSDVLRLAGQVVENPTYAAARCRLSAVAYGYRAPALDIVSYLPEDILTKVDRASMAVSLETRCPFLDHTVAEFALTLALRIRKNGQVGKLPLRRLLYRRVPRALLDRPKMGFGVPLAEWLRGPLRGRMTAYLDGECLPLLGLEPEPARAAWREFLGGGQDQLTARLWNVFTLAAWVEHWCPEPAEAT